MALILFVALLILLFAGIGIAVHFLWIIAALLFVFWVVGFGLGRGAEAGRRGWYRW